ncbi:MAG: methylenetetrahydrofolate reductase [NAD(P)H] [Bacteroidetes bacterium GWF2_33_38]|nr:MAG: methylenetetrahydrofolate reductase [NAD(P)H] [Bacteroidetes bacterium GWF2_33_38]OFY72906.1 MAG: methylenetetrahydrofolate reductase [NAD(P)H] [Bacteroidetes bacterium RIFOXYA12_FULL_33_9]OFY92137.1 MAG: methylenetetrahydrofolate reductase [NAD(P)H] [Bacteroidetes bacterium RIFOXYA2_FULL_33_7]
MNNKKVTDYINESKNPLFTFEILPPLKGHNIDTIYQAIEPLLEFGPSFINVTYHQQEEEFKTREDGLIEKKTVSKRPGTVAISAAIKYKYKIPVVPHLICGGFSQEETEDALLDLHFLEMRNLLVLRGDPQKNQRRFTPEKGGHEHSLGLIEQIMNLNKGIYLDNEMKNKTTTNFCVGVAGYPEKHAESPNMEEDLKYLKQKIDAGAEYIVTQMFFDNKKYFDFVKLCRSKGINVPIIPGLKPIANFNDVKVIPQIFSIDIPNELIKEVSKCKTNDEVCKVGTEWTIQQSKELIKFGVPSLHYFTIGKSKNIKKIAKEIF